MICYDCKKMLDCWIWREAIIDGEDGVGSCEEFAPKTEFARIRNMSIDELADFLLEVHTDGWCKGSSDSMEDCPYDKEWLESEVEE